MAANPRHGQLARPKGGEDLGEISHDDSLVPVDMWHARLPVVRVALGTKINPRRMGFVFERPGTDQEFGVLTVDLLGDAGLHHHSMRPRQEVQHHRRGLLEGQHQSKIVSAGGASEDIFHDGHEEGGGALRIGELLEAIFGIGTGKIGAVVELHTLAAGQTLCACRPR